MSVHLRRERVIALARGWRGPQPAAKAAARPDRRIDDLVAWAYREELPKTPRAAGPAGFTPVWGKIEEWAAELSLAGPADNAHGVVPDLSRDALPHPDAILIHNAVCDLDSWPLALPDDWSPLGDCGDLGAAGAAAVARALALMVHIDRAGERRLRRPAGRLLLRGALLGAPDTGLERPAIDVERGDNGAPLWFVRRVMWFDGPDGPVAEEIEADGWDARRRIPQPEAYNRLTLRPDPVDAILARGEHEIWHAALCALAETLEERLQSARPLPPAFPARPWEAAVSPPRVLRDLRAG